MDQLPVLIIIIPLLTAFLVSAASLVKPKFAIPVSMLGLIGLLVVTVLMLLEVLKTPDPIHYVMGGWTAPYGIEFVVDRMNAGLLVLVAFTALITLIHSIPLLEDSLGERQNFFQVLYLLLVAGLAGMTITGDAFNLYVMIEIVALSSYALIALAGGRANLAALHYIILGSIGAGLYLLGVGYLFLKTGSLNMAQLREIIPLAQDSPTLLVAFAMIMIGLFIKMGLFPLHSWLPNAYTTAIDPVSTLISPLATKVTIYVMARMMFWVFDPSWIFGLMHVDTLMVWIASIGVVAGGLYALAQNDIKRMLTYIVVAEVGYMVGGFWLGNQTGFTGASFHILNDVLVTLCLFMAMGSIYYKTGNYTLTQFRHLFVKMPWTMAGFVVGLLTIIGIPPTSGFISKWYLISGAIEAGQYQFVVALISASLINAVLVFRIIETALIRTETTADDLDEVWNEAPAVMVIPLLVVAASILVLGLSASYVVESLITPILPI